MKWDQIEYKWVAMTCRVRPDWPTSTRIAAAADGQAGDVAKTQNAAPDGAELAVAQASASVSRPVE